MSTETKLDELRKELIVVSTITGQVIFQADPIPVEVDAYMNGKVVEGYKGMAPSKTLP